MPKYRKMLTLGNPAINEMFLLLSSQSRVTICNWCIDYTEQNILPIYEKYLPNDTRGRHILTISRTEPTKDIKKAVRDEANLIWKTARELDGEPAAQTAARAVGQAASAINTITHCIGIAVYGALSIAYDKIGKDAPWVELEQCATIECEKMLYALRAVAIKNEPNPSNINWGC
jgi:hypothetical protein